MAECVAITQYSWADSRCDYTAWVVFPLDTRGKIDRRNLSTGLDKNQYKTRDQAIDACKHTGIKYTLCSYYDIEPDEDKAYRKKTSDTYSIPYLHNTPISSALRQVGAFYFK